MTGKEFKEALLLLKLSVSTVSRMLGVNERTVFKWMANKDSEIPSRSTTIIMEMLLRGKVTFEDVDL